MDKNALERAVAHFPGGRRELAERLDVSVMSISHWFRRGLPVVRAVQIESETGGAVTAQELLPEVFDKPTQSGRAA